MKDTFAVGLAGVRVPVSEETASSATSDVIGVGVA
jgi:hypothetical protein